MKMNSLRKVMIVCSLILFVSGCHSAPAEVDSITIAYIAKIPQKSFHDSILHGIQKRASKHHVQVDFFPAENQRDIETQRQRLRQIAQQKSYQGVLVAPNDSQALMDDISNLDRAGIWFVLVDTPLAKNPTGEIFTHNCGFVGTDNELAGRMAAKFISSEMSDGNILMMRGNHTQKSSIDREKGFVEEISKVSRYKIVSYISGYWEKDPTFLAMDEYMKAANAPPDAIFAYSDTMAVAVSKYFEARGIRHRPIIVGVDGVLLGQQAVLEGTTDASIVQAPEVMGATALQILLNCIEEKRSDHMEVLTPVTLLKAGRTLEEVSP